jgi:hypothetical protein
MRFLFRLTTAGLMVVATIYFPLQLVETTHAQELSSSLQFKVNKIAADIASSRSNLAANGAAVASDELKARQFKQRIDSYATVLAKMPSADDPILVSAKQDLAELQKEYDAVMSGGGAGTSPEPTSAASTAAPSQSSSTTQATTAAQAAAASSGPQLVSGQRVQVKKLATNMANVTGDIVVTGPSPMQSGEVVGKYNKSMQQFADALGRYEAYKHDPDVQTAATNYQALVNAITAEYQRAQDQLQQLGDVQARLVSIEQNLRSQRAPGALYPPFTEADASEWIGLQTAARETAQAAIVEIEEIAPLAYLPDNRGVVQDGSPYDSQDLQRLFRFAQETIGDVEESFETTQDTLKQRSEFQDTNELNVWRELDPSNEHHRMNFYLSEGAEGEVLSSIDNQMALAQSVAAYQRASGEMPTAEMQARIDEIAGLRKKYLEDRITVLGDSRLPEPASTDSARLKIAEEILANDEYAFGTHGPVVLTTGEIVTREKEVSRETIKDVDVSLSGTITLSGTRETWHYKWDEFKFATPIQDESGDWYIWWITAKKYESGWEKTPIGYWISGGSVKGSMILPDNF